MYRDYGLPTLNSLGLGALLSATLFFSSSAIAQTDLSYYIGVGYGMSEIDTDVTSVSNGASLDEDDNSTEIFAGVQINENFAVEAQYMDFGEATLTGDNGDRFTYQGTEYVFTADNVAIEAKGESIGIAGLLGTDVTDRVHLFGKLGLHLWDTELSEASSAGFGKADDDGTDLFYGIGANINATEKFIVRLEAEQYEVDDWDVTNVSLSGIFAF
jgi:OOP family OmpA-OmpF porin